MIRKPYVRDELERWIIERYANNPISCYKAGAIADKAAELFAGCQPVVSDLAAFQRRLDSYLDGSGYTAKCDRAGMVGAICSLLESCQPEASEPTSEPEYWPAVDGRVPVIERTHDGKRWQICCKASSFLWLSSDCGWVKHETTWPTRAAAVEFLQSLTAKVEQQQRETTGFENFAAWRNKLAAKLDCEPSITAVEAVIDELKLAGDIAISVKPEPPTVIIGDGKPLPFTVGSVVAYRHKISETSSAVGCLLLRPDYLSLAGCQYYDLGPVPVFPDPPAPPKVTPPRPEVKLMELGNGVGGIRQWFTRINETQWIRGEDGATTLDKWRELGWREVPAEGGAK